MPRPKKAIRPIQRTVAIPEDILAQVELFLFSPLEGRVPHGRWSKYVEDLIRKDLSERANALALGKAYLEGKFE